MKCFSTWFVLIRLGWISLVWLGYPSIISGMLAVVLMLMFELNQWSQTWIKLDQSCCAVSEISAGPGGSFLHLLRHDNTNTELIDFVTMMSLQWVWGASPSYLDSHVRRVGALAAALDLDLKRPRRLTGSVAGGRQLHPRPGQLQSAGDTTDTSWFVTHEVWTCFCGEKSELPSCFNDVCFYAPTHWNVVVDSA